MSDFQFLVDWNDDGDFSDSNEDITAYVMEASWSIGFSEADQHVASETRLNLQLRNDDKRFSPENASGTLYGSLSPQKQIKIQNTASGTVELYNGYIDSINPSPSVYGDLKCEIVGVGVKQFLEGQEYFSPLWENATADEILNDIFLKVAVPLTFDKYLLVNIDGHNLIDTHWIAPDSTILNSETGITTFEYVGHNWENGIDAIQAANDVVQTERGWLFNDRSGSVVFWNRHHILLNDTIQGTVDNNYQDMEYQYDSSNIKNIVRVTNNPAFTSGSAVTLWNLDQTRELAPGQRIDFRARYTEQSSRSPVGGSNVTEPNTGDGSLQVSPSDASYVLSVLSSDARSMLIQMQNADTIPITLQTLTVNGTKLTTYNEEEIESIDETSIATYGRHVMELNLPFLNDYDFGKNLATYELTQRKDPRGIVRSITMNQRDATTTSQMVDLTMGDWINVVDDQLQHNQNYVIMGEQHRFRAGDHHTVTWVLQPTDGLDYLIIDVTGKNLIDDNRFLAV